MSESTAMIFNIQRFSIHDGPGIRTTIFFKGCNLRCFWCHNPEGQLTVPEIQFFASRCVRCGACALSCLRMAHRITASSHEFSRDRCQRCGTCAANCDSRALEITGQQMSVPELMAIIIRDRLFYETAHGGVTLSGGEPVLQADVARQLLEQCKAEDLHTAIETSGHYPWCELEKVLPATDLVIMDIKHLNAEKHRAVCGASNEQILSNARRLALTNIAVIFRIPVVPTVNDSILEIGTICKFVRDLVTLRLQHRNGHGQPAPIQLQLLPFHRLAVEKYRSLGREYRAQHLEPPSKAKLHELAKIAEIQRLDVLVG